MNYANTVCLCVCVGGEARSTATQEDSTFSQSHRRTYVYSELWSVCMCEGEKKVDTAGGRAGVLSMIRNSTM